MKERFFYALRVGLARIHSGGRAVATLLSLLLFGCFAGGAQAGPTHELLASFDRPPQNPGYGSLALGPDGCYWGTTTDGGVYGYGAIYKMKADGSDWQTVLSFTDNGTSNKGANPYAGLVSDGTGYFWGTTAGGGAGKNGTIFKVDAGTGALTTVVEFTGIAGSNKGSSPYARLVSDGAGFFWGTTYDGGAGGNGTIFKVNAGTGALTTVVEFTGIAGSNKGSYPYAGLVSDGAGSLWGTTSQGGADVRYPGYGTVYKVNVSTGVLTTVVEFMDGFGPNNKGSGPYAELVSDGAGNFWGTTYHSGANDYGTVFKVNAETGALTTVVEFTGIAGSNKGSYPYAGLVSDGAGSLWGTTYQGGASSYGTVYKVNAETGALTTVVEFTGNGASNKGRYPYAGLVNDGAGCLWGTTQSGGASGLGTVYKVNVGTGALTTLAEFTSNGAGNKGANPSAGLVSDGAGFLWGTTVNGGARNLGTVYKVNASTGALATVVEFTNGGAGNEGANPYAGLVSDGGGFFWGTTNQGGGMNSGAVYKVNASTGALTTVAVFTGNFGPYTGGAPYAGLVSDGASFFWGTTYQGGASRCGTVYKVNAGTGALTPVVEFTDNGASNKGACPYAGLVSDGAGFLWGTTFYGGATLYGGSSGYGTVYKVNASTGALTTVVDFNGGSNRGIHPIAGLVSDGAGFLWGTTSEGGAYGGGTVYKVNASTGALLTVAQFSSANPIAGLVSDGAGFLWGTTRQGGVYGAGMVYKVNASTGVLTTVLDFTGTGPQAKSGANPGYGALLKHTDGNFYGTTQNGGPGGGGTIFRLRLGPTPMTQAAGAISSTGAALHGTVNPNSYGDTAVSFQYDTSPTLSSASILSAGSAPNSGSASAVQATVSGLLPNTTYYYRIVASNTGNSVPQEGAILTFTTAPIAAPTVTTSTASAVSATSATLNGMVNSNGAATSAGYEYGTDAALASGVLVSAEATFAADAAAAQNPITVTGLQPHTSYAFRAKATNSAGTSHGTILSFTTLNTAPIAPDGSATAASGESKTITLPFAAVDADGDAVTLMNVAAGAHLTMNDFSGSSATFTPDANFAGNTSLSYTVSDGFGGTATGMITVTVADTTNPTITAPEGGFNPLTLQTAAGASGTALLPSYLGQAAIYDAVGVQETTQSPAPGTVLGPGQHTVTLTAADAARNMKALSFGVTVVTGDLASEALFTQGGDVPGAGAPGRGVPEGAKWRSFGLPSINGSGQTAFLAALQLESGGALNGVFAGSPEAPALLLKAGDAAPGTGGALFAAFKDPLLNEAGRVAFEATLSGKGITGANNRGVWTNALSADASDFRLVARLGGPAPAGEQTRWKSFASAALASGELNLLGTIAGGSAGLRVTGASDQVLCRYAADAVSGEILGEVLLREGQPFSSGEIAGTLKSFAALANVSGSPGHRRQPLFGGLHVKAALKDGRALLLNNIGAGGLSCVEAASGDALVDANGQPVGTLAGFGLAADASAASEEEASGWGAVFRAELKGSDGKAHKALVGASAAGLSLLLREGDAADPARAPGALIGTILQEPVATPEGYAAVVGLRGTGVTRGSDTALYWRGANFEGLLAREGGEAPGAGGAQYAGFVSVALPDGGTGPVFTAKLQGAKGPAGERVRVTARDDLGLWAADSSGAVRLLLRENGELGAKRVQQFAVLAMVPGSPGQARSYNDRGEIVAKVTYTDRTQAIVRFRMP